MIAASALATGLSTGHHPDPELAAQAVRQALEKAGLERADQVLLFLSRDYCRNPQPAILAAARAAGTLQVTGCTASGLFTESGWQLDPPCAAALVIAPRGASRDPEAPGMKLSFTGHGNLPYGWDVDGARAGLLDTDAATWQSSRVAGHACAEIRLGGLRPRLLRASGLRPLGEPMTVTGSQGYDLQRLGQLSAVDSIFRSIPAALRERPPLHQLALLHDPGQPALSILALNSDGSLTLSGTVEPGDQVTWAIRQPLSAEQEIRETMKQAAAESAKPAFALMFSCIGRGPIFYGEDDRDLLAFREYFPAVPLLGAYGSGQIAPAGDRNHLYRNTVVTVLFESLHV